MSLQACLCSLSLRSELFPDPEDKARGFLEYSGVRLETLKPINNFCVCVLDLCTGFIFSVEYYIASFGIY